MASHLVNTKTLHQGKTLTMIALVLATKTDKDPGFSNSTLIGGVAFVIFLKIKIIEKRLSCTSFCVIQLGETN